MKVGLSDIWSFRGFIYTSVVREFQSKYRNSLLGAAWAVLQPLALILVYTMVFSKVMQVRLPGVESTFAYSIYLCSGLLAWGLFSEIILRAQNIFIDNANLLKKVSFPKLCLPVALVSSCFINYLIIFSLFIGFLLVTGNFPGVVFLAILPALAGLLLFAVGLGITLGVLNVFFRDVGQFFSIFLQFWFWLTPIVYPVHVLPEGIRRIVEMNPMTGVMNSFQAVFVEHRLPSWSGLTLSLILGVVFCLLGLTLFRSHGAEMVDEL